MSKHKNIIEVIPPQFETVRELITLNGYTCPVCNGQGGFTEQTGRDVYNTEQCDYCQGAGRVKAEVLISWKPDI